MKNFETESFAAEEPEEEKERTFQQYIENLHLSPEDFQKDILDVASGQSEFAAWAREHNAAKNIISIDSHPEGEFLDKKSAHALAEELPFADKSFDLVLSHCAIPIVYSRDYESVEIQDKRTREIMEREIEAGLSEMLRVLRPEGELRFNAIPGGTDDDYEVFQDFRSAFDQILSKLEKEQIRCNDNF